MKLSLLIVLFLYRFQLFAQDTIYCDRNYCKVQQSEEWFYYEVSERDISDTNKVHTKGYFRSGKIRSECSYIDYEKAERHGKYTEWFESGTLRKEIDYDMGKISGRLLTYWPNGLPKRKDNYEEGNFVHGSVWDSTGNETVHYPYEIMPEFKGGISEMVKYITKNIKYPGNARRKGIEGRVIARFVVEKDGSIGKVTIIESVSPDLDAEVIRLVSDMPAFSPGLIDGVAVPVKFTMPFRFSLP
jgi:periplasmic protein TonB